MSEPFGEAFRTGLQQVHSLYEMPQDDIVSEVLTPAFDTAVEARVVSAYFTSHALAKLAAGLASYARRPTAPLRLLLSPQLSDEDLNEVRRGIADPSAVLEAAILRLTDGTKMAPTVSALARHASECLGFMVASGQAEIRFVLMRSGMFHPKQWLLRNDEDWLAVHGSGNVTYHGLFVNGEQMTVDRTWCDGPPAQQRVDKMIATFDSYWANERQESLTISAPQAVELLFADLDPHSDPPTVQDFWAAWRADFDAGLEPELPLNAPAPKPQLSIPSWLEWRDGEYAHQGRAVDAFLSAEARGVLAIATGGGKTRTALIAACELQDRRPAGGPMLVVVIVPSSTLERQWSEDVSEFGVEPFRPSLLSRDARRLRLSEIETAFGTGADRTEVIVCTQQLFTGDTALREFVERLDDDGVTTMLVGDEAHNLGTANFIEDPPVCFQSRLGLSATPVRQYDSLGTDALFEFFGPEVFEFSLREAIDSGCLVPYDYHPHLVELSSEELEHYVTLTDELWSSGFRVNDEGQAVIPNSKVEHLLRRRRAVLEQAESKVPALEAVMRRLGPDSVRRTLIYASSKGLELTERRQIEDVNSMLQRLGIVAHELTAQENAAGLGPDILRRFANGDYRVLTAMKVLDEGVDIPATESAFILASTTVEREWVQRRGRVLRRADGKTSAAIHDFVAVPGDLTESAAASILRSELRRVRSFASLARNEWDVGGPQDVAEELDAMEQEASRR